MPCLHEQTFDECRDSLRLCRRHDGKEGGLLYQVSDAFLQAVQENTRKYFWTGRITTKAGDVYEFDGNDIVKGSGYISSQCCGSTEIELGTVYASEMGITLLSNIDRYTLEDALVELFYHLHLPDGTVEEVPMGILEVSEFSYAMLYYTEYKSRHDPVLHRLVRLDT